MSRNYIEVTILSSVDSGELLGLLRDDRALGAWEGDGVLHIYWSERDWTPLLLEDLKQALSRMGAGKAGAPLEVQPVPDQDWNARWLQSLKPVHIGRRFRIRQSWYEPDPAFRGFELVIDPKRAFGSGYHATTQLVVEWLEENLRGGEHVLDLGTGTGILAMAAIRLGAAFALGIDEDPVAIECAQENAAANGFGAELKLAAGSLDKVGADCFDLAVANLDRNTILGLCGRLKCTLKKGGRVCLSGLQAEDFDDVAESLAAAGGRILSRLERGEWIALEVHF